MSCANTQCLEDLGTGGHPFFGMYQPSCNPTTMPSAVFNRDRTAEMLDILSHRLPSLYRIAYRVLGNAHDAEDAVQEALFSAYKHLHQFRGDAQISSWVTAIVLNCARHQLRRRPRAVHVWLDQRGGEGQEPPLLESLADVRPNPEVECRNGEFRALLMQSMKRLSPTLRKTFQLRYLDGLTTGETAEALGVPEGTIKARLTRARAKLKRILQPRVLWHNPSPRCFDDGCRAA
jgi:RNA polymerase sigma-70 factor, ECF subfamily